MHMYVYVMMSTPGLGSTQKSSVNAVLKISLIKVNTVAVPV